MKIAKAPSIGVSAPANGHVHSMFELGQLHGGNAYVNRGLNSPPQSNKKVAYKWYQKAADLGHIEAVYQIAYLYDTNRSEKLGYSSVAKADDVEALAWYTVAKALEKKIDRKQSRTNKTFSQETVRKRLNAEQIKEAESHARNLVEFIEKNMSK